MAENFQAAGICGGNWLINSSKSMFMGDVSPCSVGINSDLGAYGSYWMADMGNLKPRSSCKYYSYNSNILNNNINYTISSASGDQQKPQQQADSDSGDSSILMDSNLQMMGFNLSSSCSPSPEYWKQALIQSGNNSGGNYNPMLREEINLVVNPPSEIQMEWSDPKTFTGTVTGGEEDPPLIPFKAVKQDFSLDQQSLNPLNNSDNNPTASCQEISSSEFLMSTASTYHDYPLSALVQSLFESGPPQPQQQSMFNNRPMNYYGTNNLSTEPSPCWPHMLSSSVSNSTPFWNASATSLDDIRSASVLSSSQPHFVVPTLEEKSNENNLVRKIEEARNSGSVVKVKKGCEPVFKRPRIETPSPLPTFKVRKEKLGDRITALQQLVSPFGKTDTASVLHESIEYIKFLHNQVNALSTPYMKNGNAIQRHQAAERLKDSESPRVDLRNRGLCLVPMSSTFPIANETTSALWTPTFGATFR